MMLRKQSKIHECESRQFRKISASSYLLASENLKLGNFESMKFGQLEKELLKGPVWLLHTNKEECSRVQCIYFVFVYFSVVRLLVYSIPKILLAW